MNEIVSKSQNNEASGLDDIYVPGLGVRGALSDDRAEASEFRSRIGEKFSRGAALVNGWAVGTFGAVRAAGGRLENRLRRLSSETQTVITMRRKSLPQLTNRLEHTRKHFVSSLSSARSRLRGAARHVVTGTSALNTSMVRVSQNTGSRLLRATDHGRERIRTANRLAFAAMSGAVAKRLSQARSLRDGMAVYSHRRLAAEEYKRLLRITANYQLDLRTLWRAAAPLAIMLVMVVFVIQEIVTVAER